MFDSRKCLVSQNSDEKESEEARQPLDCEPEIVVQAAIEEKIYAQSGRVAVQINDGQYEARCAAQRKRFADFHGSPTSGIPSPLLKFDRECITARAAGQPRS